MILSKHALKENGNKLVKEFLSTLESVTSWLDIVNEVGISDLDASARDSSIYYICYLSKILNFTTDMTSK